MKKRKRLIAEIVIDEQTTITVDGNKMSAEFGALDRGSLTDVVDWGIYANRGSISFIDKQGYFNNTNVNQFRLKGAKVVFYLAKDEKTKIATFIVDDASYDEETRNVEIQLVSGIVKKQNEKVERTAFPFGERSCEYLIGLDANASLNSADYGLYYPSFGFEMGDDSTILKKTMIYCPYLPPESAWSRAIKICQATMCRVIEDENGDAKIQSPFPIRTPIIVRPKNIVRISNGTFVRVLNSQIGITDRKKYENKLVDQLSKSISVSYDELGEPISISGCDFSFGDLVQDPTSGNYSLKASISLYFETNYKIYQNTMVRKITTREKRNTNGNVARYSTEEIVGGSNVVGLLKNNLLYNDGIAILDEYTDGSVAKTESVSLDFWLDYFEDLQTINLQNTGSDKDYEYVTIPSNDLIQELSYFKHDTGNKQSLGEHILQEVKRRYSHGIECFEIECLFNQYYNENNDVVFDGKDLSKHFRKYDIIIPYVVRNGVTEPLRVDENGDPKKFRIIGISYTDDGLLKQKLYVQEERYDID